MIILELDALSIPAARVTLIVLSATLEIHSGTLGNVAVTTAEHAALAADSRNSTFKLFWFPLKK
jgi:hypothetical protein